VFFTTAIVVGWFPFRWERSSELDSADDPERRRAGHKEIGAPTVIRVQRTRCQHDKTAAKDPTTPPRKLLAAIKGGAIRDTEGTQKWRAAPTGRPGNTPARLGRRMPELPPAIANSIGRSRARSR